MIAIVHRIFQLYPDRLDRSAFPNWRGRLVEPHHGAARGEVCVH